MTNTILIDTAKAEELSKIFLGSTQDIINSILDAVIEDKSVQSVIRNKAKTYVDINSGGFKTEKEIEEETQTPAYRSAHKKLIYSKDSALIIQLIFQGSVPASRLFLQSKYGNDIEYRTAIRYAIQNLIAFDADCSSVIVALIWNKVFIETEFGNHYLIELTNNYLNRCDLDAFSMTEAWILRAEAGYEMSEEENRRILKLCFQNRHLTEAADFLRKFFEPLSKKNCKYLNLDYTKYLLRRYWIFRDDDLWNSEGYFIRIKEIILSSDNSERNQLVSYVESQEREIEEWTRKLKQRYEDNMDLEADFLVKEKILEHYGFHYDMDDTLTRIDFSLFQRSGMI